MLKPVFSMSNGSLQANTSGKYWSGRMAVAFASMGQYQMSLNSGQQIMGLSLSTTV